MVEQFVGTWKLVSSENFEEFLKEIGKLAHISISQNS